LTYWQRAVKPGILVFGHGAVWQNSDQLAAGAGQFRVFSQFTEHFGVGGLAMMVRK